MNMKQINKSVWVTYIIDCIFLILYFIFDSLVLFSNNIENNYIYTLVSILFFLLCCLCSVILLVLVIINFIKNKEKKVRWSMIVMIIVLLLISVIGLFFPTKIKTTIEKNYKKQSVKILTPLIKSIKNYNTNKYVYFIDDLKKLNNSIDYSKYDSTSYITYFNNEIYVCMSNSKYKVDGNENDLHESIIYSSKEKCNFIFTFSQAEEYSKTYFENKYNDIVVKDAVAIDNCEYDYLVPICPKEKKVKIDTSYGNVIIDLKTVNGKIDIEDNSGEVFSNLTSNDLLLGKIENYTMQYLNVNKINLSTMINDINYSESANAFVIGTEYVYNEARKYAQSLGKYLQGKNLNTNIIIRKLGKNKESEIQPEYIIYIKVNGENLTIE